MNRWTEDIRSVLERAPTGALPLSCIQRELQREGVVLDPEDPWVLSSLREGNETFRVIPFYPEYWAPKDRREGAGRQGGDPWVLLSKTPEQGFGRIARARTRIQDGVRAWAVGLDQASPGAVARWVRGNLEGARICTALATGKS
jgi:hypothetical protein